MDIKFWLFYTDSQKCTCIQEKKWKTSPAQKIDTTLGHFSQIFFAMEQLCRSYSICGHNFWNRFSNIALEIEQHRRSIHNAEKCAESKP